MIEENEEMDRRQADEQPSFVLSNPEINKIVKQLQDNRELRKELDKEDERLKQALYNHMNEHEELVNDENGDVMLSWKYSSDSQTFDTARFKDDLPDLYSKYLIVKPGTRRLLLKK